MEPGRSPTHTNRLIQATSPYLLQHAHNPVDWYPWGEEALAKAKAEDKPILLSIGYSSCHWCHVMAHESFEDEAIASVMNQHFVSVKVDREERPDLDDIYMAATLAMNSGQGGWPMTVFLTPDQEPLFAGTYFPPADRWGRPGFPTLLQRIAELWRTDRARLKEQAAELVEYLQTNARPAPGEGIGEAELRRALDQYGRDFDPEHGGFGGAPKFPPATGLSLLLRCHRRFKDDHALEMVRKTLDAMARGGMYDQIGGGFCRYSTDARWLVPHFEKMLYDNALLAKAYLEGYQVTGDDFYRRVAVETLDYILREMTSPEGGFYSATDADSEGEEGKFFVWTPEQVAEILGEEEGRRFCAYYDVTADGNWEGKSVPNRMDPTKVVAWRLGVTVEDLERSVETGRPRVYEARRKRVPPGRDDKVLTAWNGLMIGAMSEGFRVLRDTRYLHAAEGAADFLLATLTRPDGGLFRTYRAGKAHLDAYLEDYACLSEALVDLYEARGATRYLLEARRLAERMITDFGSTEGGFFSTAVGHETLVVRHREGHDGAAPAANATAAHVLARLGFHFDRGDLREEALRAVRAYGKAIARQPRAFAKSLIAVDLLLERPVELAFVGTPDAPDLVALQQAVARRYLPNRIVGYRDPLAEVATPLPLLSGKGLVGGKAALYVCRSFSCQAPITDPAAVGVALEASPRDGAGSTLAAFRIAGVATPEGTVAYAKRFPALAAGFGPLGSTGLKCSRVGFGCYRVDDETDEHREALRKALLSGCNLIDTSTNYTDGGSERRVGRVLQELARVGALRREEVIVVSKIGYVQGQNLELATEREAERRPFPEMVKYADGVWHCIHPEFLEDQLGRSLDRLQLATLDVCLLHNPEYFFSDAHKRGDDDLEGLRREFDRRLRAAFAFFETQVAAGRLRFYGVSSNTCTAPADDPEATSLTRMVAAAREAGGGGHHFRVLQLPMNLMESRAVLTRNNGAVLDQTVLDHAQQEAIAVLVNRPLNAMVGHGLLRLAEVEFEAAPIEWNAQSDKVAALEAEYRRDIAPRLQAAEGGLSPDRFFRWSEELQGMQERAVDFEHWKAIESQVVLPRLYHVVQVLDRDLHAELAAVWRAWRDRYLLEVRKLLDELRRGAAGKTHARTSIIIGAVDRLLPVDRRGASLSRKALWVVASTPGVSCVLNGMRTASYVEDALGILAWPPLESPQRVYEALRDVRV